MDCTKLNCPMQTGTVTENCGENCPWRTTAKISDLISRAAAIKCAIDAVDDWDGGWNPNRETVIRKYFEELPAVDAVPVVHARWHELKDGTEECTNCLGLCPHEENYNGDVIFNFGCEYCPWCGAKMDGERRDSE